MMKMNTAGNVPNALKTDDFAAVSLELFGDAQYGNSMASIVTLAIAPAFEGYAVFAPDATVYTMRRNATPLGTGSRNLREYDLPDRATPASEQVRQQLEGETRYASPFVMEYGAHLPKSGFVYSGPHKCIQFRPVGVTAESLARYVQARDYAGHILRGTLGKCLSTLLRVAGQRIPPHDHDVADRYIGSKELRQCITAELGATALGGFQSKTKALIVDQLAMGGSKLHGEVVLEGPLKVRTSATSLGDRIAYDQISFASLGIIASHYKAGGTRDLLVRMAAQADPGQ